MWYQIKEVSSMWFGWNRFGFGGPWGFGFAPMYQPPYYGGYAPYYGGYGMGMYGGPQYGGSQYGGSYDPRTMELMAMRDELEFMSQRVDEILRRLDEIEREMR